jgi:hypothetical protein
MLGEGKTGGVVAKGILKERPSNEKLQETHSDFAVELIGFDFGPNHIKIQSTIANKLLEIDEEGATKAFEVLCRSFSEVCHEHHIKFDPVDLFILVDDGLSRGTSTKFRDANDGSLFAEILIPAKDFRVHEYWKYTFLHELGHSWFSIRFSSKDMKFGYEDFLIDLVAICTFRKILPPHKRIYREVRKHRTFFLTQQTKRFLGKELYRQILTDPETYLRDLRQRV